jgi:RNA polymerase sigma factor (sigma-70 family)
MQDEQIIELYLQRNEKAVEETQAKYGSYCFRIAKNILTIKEDVEECVNDTWNLTWNKIPPIIPVSLKAFLGKLVRDVSLSRYRASHAQKRYSGMEVMFDELEECIPSDFDVEQSFDNQQLSEMINSWLETLSKEDRVLFVKRYYYGDAVKNLAKVYGYTENQMAQRMLRLRKNLKTFLFTKGVTI